MTPLQIALETGDVPTAHLWFDVAGSAKRLLERGVALMEALADPMFEERSSRDAAVRRLIEYIEDGIAADDGSALLLLSALLAQPARYGITSAKRQLSEIAALADAPRATKQTQKTYDDCRASLIATPVKAATKGGAKTPWRFDDKGRFEPQGADIILPKALATTLANLRNSAARLCGSIAETTSSELTDEYAEDRIDFTALHIVCAQNTFHEIAMAVDELGQNLTRAQAGLASFQKKSGARKS